MNKINIITLLVILSALPSFSDEYTVKKGDTAFAICRKLGIRYSQLKSHNPKKDLNFIKPGEKLHVPNVSRNYKSSKRIKGNFKNSISNTFSFRLPIKAGRNSIIKRSYKNYSLFFLLKLGKIVSSFKGVVSYAGRLNFLGKVVFIKHYSNIYTVYKMYNVRLKVRTGETVDKGTLLAVKSDRSKFVRFKFNILRGTRPINPNKFIR